jgi:hypothetical protein
MDRIIEKIEYKNVTKIFFAWQEEKEEKWLRDMSKEGWHLDNVGFFNFRFIKGRPMDIIYKFDYRPFRSEKIDDYIILFEDAGWEYVDAFAGWYYFRTEANKKYNLDLYNDNASKIRKYNTLRWVLILVSAPIVYNLPNLYGRIIRTVIFDATEDFLARTLIINFAIPLTMFLTVVLGILVFAVIRISLVIKKIKQDIKE